MKKFIIFLFALILGGGSMLAQSESEKNELYPTEYTFSKALDFQQKGEYEKAVWFYINLFPENESEVVEKVKALEVKLDTVDMSIFIRKSFAMYSPFDPDINKGEEGELNMDFQQLSLKGSWGDALIKKLTIGDKPLSAKDYNFSGIEKVKSRDFNGAIEDFTKAIKLEPTGQFYFNRAYAKSMIKDFEGAILDYNETINLAYRLAEAYFERGYCYDQTNEPNKAIADYTDAIKVDDQYADAYNNRAVTKLKQKKYEAAIKDFSKAIKINPNFSPAYVNRGYAKKEIGDVKGACEDWNKALELGYGQAQGFIDSNCK